MSFREFILSSGRRLVMPLPGYVGLKLTGTSAQQNLNDQTVQFNTVKAFVSRFNPDAAFPLLDLTVEAEALGAPIIFMDNDAPYITREIVRSKRDLNRIRDSGLEGGRMKVFVEVARLMAENLREIKSGSFVTGPFTLAGQLMGIVNLYKSIAMGEELPHDLIELSTTVITDYVEELSDTGIDFIVVAEPTASLSSRDEFLKFSKPFLSQIIGKAKVSIILHICGQIDEIIEDMVKTGASALSIGEHTDVYNAALKWKDTVWIGNYSSSRLATQRREEVVADVNLLLKSMRENRNFVLSTSCDIPYLTPLENIEALINEGKRQST